MLEKFKSHINNHFPNLLNSTFLLACSGGLDSVVLTHLCKAASLSFSLAHCNFQLRGSESEMDAEFVKKLAAEANINIHTTSFDTDTYINTHKVNIQIAARELRYAWFAEIMEQKNIPTLVTAHHADDNLETFLINVSRGTGIEGLTGIPEKTETISRPLLQFSRADILAYAKANNLKWREDHSNKDTKYLRNKIRHEIVPLLKELHPTFLANFQKTSGYLQDSNLLLKTHVELLKSRCFQQTASGYQISIDELQVLYPQKAYVHALLKDYGFTDWKAIVKLLNGLSGKEIYSKTHRLLKNRAYLILESLKDENNTIYKIEKGQANIEMPLKIHITPIANIKEQAKNIIYVDAATLKYPLSVRKWKKGDYFYPLGMTGKKKLSKFFKDEKMSVIAKEKQWLLCTNNTIVWVLGKRADQRFAVTQNTKEILKFTIDI